MSKKEKKKDIDSVTIEGGIAYTSPNADLYLGKKIGWLRSRRYQFKRKGQTDTIEHYKPAQYVYYFKDVLDNFIERSKHGGKYGK